MYIYTSLFLGLHGRDKILMYDQLTIFSAIFLSNIPFQAPVGRYYSPNRAAPQARTIYATKGVMHHHIARLLVGCLFKLGILVVGGVLKLQCTFEVHITENISFIWKMKNLFHTRYTLYLNMTQYDFMTSTSQNVSQR